MGYTGLHLTSDKASYRFARYIMEST
jgi:hypothetical protein